MLRVFLVLVIATLLSSCEQKGSLTGSGTETKINEIHGVVIALFDRVRGGVRENPCVAGGPQAENCYYVITITAERDSNGIYQGQNSNRVCIQNKLSGNALEDCDHFNPATRSFKVKGNPALGKNKDYDLFSQPPSDVLACHDNKGQVTDTCVERTTDLPIVP
jgi:hypothetical protein